VAAAIAVVLVVVGLVLYLNSDIRAANLQVGVSSPAPTTASQVPQSLSQLWTASTDADLGAVASADGVVVTTDPHGITALDAVTGQQRWSYSRSNRTLCAVANGKDTGVTGIITVYSENGWCSEVNTFQAVDGERGDTRTGPYPEGGSLVDGGDSAGWFSPDLIEIWRYDLVRTAQYGVQPNPPNPGTQHTGCTFTDLAITQTQFATVEHCAAQGTHARVVLNFDDPGAQNSPDKWDNFKFSARMDVDSGSDAAVIVGLTSDRVAVLVASPAPAVVVYDAAGTEISRTPVNVPAAEITAAAATGRPLPSVDTGSARYTLVGTHLVATTDRTESTAAPRTTLTTAASSSGASSAAPTTVSVNSPEFAFVTEGARGLPAVLGDQLLVPVTQGLSVISADSGAGLLGNARTIAVDRSGWAGRVDATAVGSTVVEVRGPTVVALGAAA
jgi:hypothetical protein